MDNFGVVVLAKKHASVVKTRGEKYGLMYSGFRKIDNPCEGLVYADSGKFSILHGFGRFVPILCRKPAKHVLA